MTLSWQKHMTCIKCSNSYISIFIRPATTKFGKHVRLESWLTWDQ